MQLFPSIESTLLLSGPAGTIEIIASPQDENHPHLKNATALICHPHPLFGGTMHNKVVTTLSRVFRDIGLRSVRFNFRGVGKSSGIHDEGRGEVEDLLALVNWINTLFPNGSIWLAGFSFGAYVATKAAMQISPKQLVTIAPQVSRFKQDDLARVTCPWLLVQGEQDEVVSAEEVFAWVDTLPHKPKVLRIPTAGHFFHGQLLELRRQLENELKDYP
ncbi:MAG TPA: alpha/beta fold hydrolase [Gammaproteobacteria bacterium]|nr:alpha/beta fold hydrolase [Gammaproteobacteria bacterium]